MYPACPPNWLNIGHIVTEAQALPYLAGTVSREVFLRYFLHLHIIGGYGNIIEYVAGDTELALHGGDIYAGSVAMLHWLERLKSRA